MPLIDCGTNLVLTRSASCFTIDAPISNQIPTFATTDTTPYQLKIMLNFCNQVSKE